MNGKVILLTACIAMLILIGPVSAMTHVENATAYLEKARVESSTVKATYYVELAQVELLFEIIEKQSCTQQLIPVTPNPTPIPTITVLPTMETPGPMLTPEITPIPIQKCKDIKQYYEGTCKW